MLLFQSVVEHPDELAGHGEDVEVRLPWVPPERDDDGGGLKRALQLVWWLIFVPVNLVFLVTIPDVRMAGCFKRLYMVTTLL